MSKRILLIALTLALTVSASSQDYYSGKDTVRADAITYKVSGAHSILYLENIEYSLYDYDLSSDMPYNTKSKEYYTDQSMPFCHARQSDIEQIVLPILNPQNTQQNISILIVMAVEPKSKIVQEVLFHLWPEDNEKVLSIPPTTFEEVERNLVGRKVENNFPEYYEDANYVEVYCAIKF